MLKSTKTRGELVCAKKYRNAPSSCSGQARWQREGDKEGLQQGAATMWVAASPREGCTKTFNWERCIEYFSVHDDCQNIISALRKRIASLSTLICWNTSVYLNIAKGTTDPRVHYLDQTWAQRLNQMSASKSWRNFSLEGLTKIQLQSFWSNFSLRILTKNSPSKSWQNLNFKILTKYQP